MKENTEIGHTFVFENRRMLETWGYNAGWDDNWEVNPSNTSDNEDRYLLKVEGYWYDVACYKSQSFIIYTTPPSPH